MRSLAVAVLLLIIHFGVMHDRVTAGQPVVQGELSPLPEGAFTIAVIPDTQRYRGRNTKSQPESDDEITNSVFASITEWIVQHREDQNIVFVSHVGDIVDKNVAEQWIVAQRCMDSIHGLIPYGMTVGNHDMVGHGDSTLFQNVFGESRYKEFDWYGGAFHSDRPTPEISGNNANSFQQFSAGGLDFLFFHLECNAPDDVLSWTNRIIAEHPDRRVIITTHMDLGPLHRPKDNHGFLNDPKGRMQWKKCHGKPGNTSVQMWEKCYKHHKNLILVCSGDQSRSQAMHVIEKGVHENEVHSCLTDYSSDGSLRLYRFSLQDNRVDAITYNVLKGGLTQSTKVVGDSEEHQFSFNYLMN